MQLADVLCPYEPRAALLTAEKAVAGDSGYAREALGLDATLSLTRRYLTDHRDLEQAVTVAVRIEGDEPEVEHNGPLRNLCSLLAHDDLTTEHTHMPVRMKHSCFRPRSEAEDAMQVYGNPC